jgi:hypothetical protein
MNGSGRGRTSCSRPLAALGAVAVLALLALAALVLGNALSDDGGASRADVHAISTIALGEHDHGVQAVHAFRQQPSTRARSVAWAALGAAGVIAAAWAYRRLQLVPSGRLRSLRVSGLPPGRGPPSPQIV